MTTDVLGLPEVTDGQASQGVIHNQALRELDVKNGARLLSRLVTAEPGSPASGDAYLLGASPTGTNWSTQANKIAHFYGGSWKFYTPVEGWRAWVNDENVIIRYDGAAWDIHGGLLFAPFVAVSSTPFTVTTTAHRGRVLLVDTSAGTITLNLPAAASAGDGFVVMVHKNAAANSLILDASGAELINGSVTLTLTDIRDSRILVCNGTAWFTVGGGGAGGGGGVTLPISDVNTLFQNEADASKTVKFNLSPIATATQRTYSTPNKDGTFAMLDDVVAGGNGSNALGENAPHNGLLYSYAAGLIRQDNVITIVPGGSVLLTEGSTNYVECSSAGAVTANTTGFTAGRFPMATVTTLAGSPSAIDVVTDKRSWAFIGATGSVGQMVSTTSTTEATSNVVIPYDGTIPQNTEGTAYADLDTAITPKNASSKLVIEIELNISCEAVTDFELALFVDSTADALRAWTYTLNAANYTATFRMRHIVTAGSLTARTYKIRFGSSTGTATDVHINRTTAQADLFGVAAISSMMITEYLP